MCGLDQIYYFSRVLETRRTKCRYLCMYNCSTMFFIFGGKIFCIRYIIGLPVLFLVPIYIRIYRGIYWLSYKNLGSSDLLTQFSNKMQIIKLLFVSDVFVSLSEIKINKCLGGYDAGSGLHYLRRFNREDAWIRIIVACDKKNPIIAIV